MDVGIYWRLLECTRSWLEISELCALQADLLLPSAALAREGCCALQLALQSWAAHTDVVSEAAPDWAHAHEDEGVKCATVTANAPAAPGRRQAGKKAPQPPTAFVIVLNTPGEMARSPTAFLLLKSLLFIRLVDKLTRRRARLSGVVTEP